VCVCARVCLRLCVRVRVRVCVRVFIYTYTYKYIYIFVYEYIPVLLGPPILADCSAAPLSCACVNMTQSYGYDVATISRLPKNTDLFCKRAL